MSIKLQVDREEAAIDGVPPSFGIDSSFETPDITSDTVRFNIALNIYFLMINDFYIVYSSTDLWD